MANLQRMGGIGAGVMQGLQFMRQRESDARQGQALENQNQQLQMNQQIHGEKMGALNRENEERQRADSLGKLQTQIESVYGQGPDALPEYDRQKMYIDKALGTGLIKPAELDVAKKTYDGMVKMAGVDAFDAAVLRKDVTPLQKLFSSKGLGDIAYDPKADALSFTPPGATSPQSLDRKGLLQIGIMSAARDRELANSKAALDARKTEAEIRLKEADAGLKDRLPIDRSGAGGAGGAGRGAGGKEPKPFSLDISEVEKIAPIDPATSKPDPQKVISIASNAESIFNLNPAIRDKSPYAAYQIAAGIEKGDIKPELVRDPSTNTYYKAVKYGGATVRIGGETEADPDSFYANNPAAVKVRINNDRTWLSQYTQSIKDPKQRETMDLALRGDTPQGAAARNEIIAMYNKVRESGQPVPDFLRQQYGALQTADRLKTAPPVEQKPSQAQSAPATAPDTTISGKPSYEGYIDASERLDKVKADAEKMSPDRREQYLANRVPELEALIKHHSNYLKYR